MPAPLLVAAAGASIASGLLGFASSRSSAKRAKKLTKANLELSREEGEENLRRMGISRGQSVSGARAAAAGSNLLMSGTTKRFMDEMNAQWMDDMKWEKRKQGIEQKRIKLGGQATASQIQAGGIASLLGGASSAFKYLG